MARRTRFHQKATTWWVMEQMCRRRLASGGSAAHDPGRGIVSAGIARLGAAAAGPRHPGSALGRLFLTRAIAAATTVDAAAGLLAGCAPNRFGAGHGAAAVFMLGALAYIGCHLVLLPGLI